jgi:hypothetical protein
VRRERRIRIGAYRLAGVDRKKVIPISARCSAIYLKNPEELRSVGCHDATLQ